MTLFLQDLALAVLIVVGLAWGVYATSAMTRLAAARVLQDASKSDRVVLFWWRFLAQWTAFAAFVGLTTSGLAPGWAFAAVLLFLAACVALVRPIREFTAAWFRSLPEPWDQP